MTYRPEFGECLLETRLDVMQDLPEGGRAGPLFVALQPRQRFVAQGNLLLRPLLQVISAMKTLLSESTLDRYAFRTLKTWPF